MRAAVVVVLALVPGCRAVFGIDDTVVAGDGATGADASRADAAVDAKPDSAFDAPPITCPQGYVQRTSRSCHRFVSNRRPWANAESDCEAAGAHLVVVDDAEENDALTTVDELWIGYSERVTAGTFLWVTGVTTTFEPWALGQPSEVGGGLCVTHEIDGWHDDDCGSNKYYVCEYDGLPANPASF